MTAVVDYQRIEQAIHFIESNITEQPTLDEVSAHLNLSPHHVQRLFRRWAGVSPKRFLQFLTTEYTASLLARSQNLLDVTYEAGLSSPSRLHDLWVGVRAMTPGQARSGGKGMTLRYGIHPTPFGNCWIALTDLGICELHFAKPDEGLDAVKTQLQTSWPAASLSHDAAATGEVIQHLFAPSETAPTTPLLLHVRGTNFQIQVWKALLEIPAGAVVSYGHLAQRLGRPSAARAVGGAIGRNPIAYIIPCHRVLRSSGAFHGYRWGTARKKIMLAREAAQHGDDGA